MSTEQIPVVDFGGWSHPSRRAEVEAELGRALERFGFVAVGGHGIPVDLLDRAYDLAARCFALPGAVKRRYETPGDGRQRGYTSFGVDHRKDTLVVEPKEFWHVGRDLGPGHPLHLSGDIPPNQWPTELPEFAAVYSQLFAALEGLAGRLLEAVERHLDLEPGYFARLTADGNSVLRLIHYPDVDGALPPGAVRAAPHEDINLLTVLPASIGPGLEVMTRDGRWIGVNPPPNVMICDTGDMMALLTAGRIPAATHRVVNFAGEGGGRYSIPFFLHPHPDALLAPMVPGFARAVTTREFFRHRLRATGVDA